MHVRAGEQLVEIDLIIFDKDGTLVELHEPWGSWADEVAHALAAHIPPEQLLPRMGWDASTKQIAPETPLAIASADTLQAVLATWLYDAGMGWSAAMALVLEATSRARAPTARPLCPLLPLLDYLSGQGVTLGVVTTDDHEGVVRDLAPLGVLGALTTIISADTGLPLKPAPDTLMAACTAAHIAPERTMVIGDSVADLLMGRAAGVALTVGVLSGSGRHDDLAPHADFLLPNVGALLSMTERGGRVS